MNRKERRRQAKLRRGAEPTKPAPSGGAFGGHEALALLQGERARPAPAAEAPVAEPPLTEGAIANRVQFEVLDILRGGGAAAATLPAAAAATVEIAERVWSEQRPAAEARKQPGFACSSGCAWCCYQQVSVAPAEAIAIAGHVRTSFSPAALAALKSRLAALDSKSRGLGPRGRASLKAPCAFLIDGTCSIYAVRPLRCRGVYSRDAGHCRWAMENPDEIFGNRERHGRPGPYPVEPAKIMDAALTGLARAFAEVRLPWGALDLTAALRAALDTPDLAERYRAGEPVFAGTELPDRDD